MKSTVILFAFYYNNESNQNEIRGTQYDIYNIANYFKNYNVHIFSDINVLPGETDNLSLEVGYKRLHINLCRKFEDFVRIYRELQVCSKECIFYFSGHATEDHMYCFPDENIGHELLIQTLYTRLHKRCILICIQDCCNSSDLQLKYKYNLRTKQFEETAENENIEKNIMVISSASSGIRSFSTSQRGSLFTSYLVEFLSRCKRSSSLADMKKYIDDSIVSFDDTLVSDINIYSTIEYLGYIPDLILPCCSEE